MSAENGDQVALFIDLDNFAGFCSGFGLKMELNPVIRKLTEYGRVVIRRSYGDIYKLPFDSTVKESIRIMLQNNLVQHEDVRHLNRYKNSSDIKLIIEALSVAYTNPTITTFAIVADDRDYMPLFSKLREIGKTVIGIGSSKDSTQEFYRSACDNFLYHDALTGFKQPLTGRADGATSGQPIALDKETENEVISLFIEATKAVEAKGRMPLGSGIAQMMRALKSDLDFEDYGFSGLKAIGELARSRGLVRITPHGGDILVNCLDAEIKEYFETQDIESPNPEQVLEDVGTLADRYQQFVESKLKAELPLADKREIVYDSVVEALEKVTYGVSLNQLSRSIAADIIVPDVGQSSIYKILYGLFRSRAFVCADSYSQYDPIIVGLAIDRSDMDRTFITNLLSVFSREGRGIPFEATAWSLYLFDDEDHSELIAELQGQQA